MSDEPQKPFGKWLNSGSVAVFTFAVAAAYQGAHYATAVWLPADCFYVRTHRVGDRWAPQWVDTKFFWLANRIDELFGIDPWRK